MASTGNASLTASEQAVPETTTPTSAAAATTATAPAAPATMPPPTNIASNDAQASSSQAAADLAVSFPLQSMATAEPAADSSTVITIEDLTEEEEN